MDWSPASWVWLWVALVVGVIGFFSGMFCCWLAMRSGFRMGRQSIDKPLAPIIKPKQTTTVPEDPWHEPMHGTEQNRRTVEE